MSTIRVTKKEMGSNMTVSSGEVKRITLPNQYADSISRESAPAEDVSAETSSQSQEVSVSDEERRAKRREEYKEAASIRERAIQMQKQAEQRIKETEQFTSLMQQAKEDPTILAKALNMDPGEFQRKIFNKTYSIQDDPAPVREESFEEQTRRKLEEYDQERAQEKERKAQEAREYQEREFNRVKNSYINDNILPHINENHEFIHKNDKHSCAALVYDLMNQAFQDHCASGGDPNSFELKAQDVVEQMEEELQRRAEDQLTQARSMNKLKRFFRDEEVEYQRPEQLSSSSSRSRSVFEEDGTIKRKDFTRKASPTISSSLGVGAPPFGSSTAVPERNLPLSDRHARRLRAMKNLGSK